MLVFNINVISKLDCLESEIKEKVSKHYVFSIFLVFLE